LEATNPLIRLYNFESSFNHAYLGLIVEGLKECHMPTYITQWVQCFIEKRKLDFGYEGQRDLTKHSNQAFQKAHEAPLYFSYY
jgi:hypothetical protein